jgi:hypothetical protein
MLMKILLLLLLLLLPLLGWVLIRVVDAAATGAVIETASAGD